jgi:hypothetical protein
MEEREETVTLGLGGRSDDVDDAGDNEAELMLDRLAAPVGKSGRALFGGGVRLLVAVRYRCWLPSPRVYGRRIFRWREDDSFPDNSEPLRGDSAPEVGYSAPESSDSWVRLVGNLPPENLDEMDPVSSLLGRAGSSYLDGKSVAGGFLL